MLQTNCASERELQTSGIACLNAVASHHGAVEEEEAAETPNWGFPRPRQRLG